MRTGDEADVGPAVRAERTRRGLSQADLAEKAGVSARTVQRMEAGLPVAAASRRAVLAVLGIDPGALPGPAGQTDPPAGWQAIEDTRPLVAALIAARTVEIDVDRDGWREARRRRPWYRQDIVIAIGDPISGILRAVDAIRDANGASPGQRARSRDLLAGSYRAARAMRWSMAMRAEAGDLEIFLGAPEDVEARTPAG